MEPSCSARGGSRARPGIWRRIHAAWFVLNSAEEAVVVEGVAEIAGVAVRREFLKKYQPKYHFDMAGMEKDILAMKEPVFAVRPRVVFGLYEKNFMGSATRWMFKG